MALSPHPSVVDLCRAVTWRMVRRSMLTALVVGGVLFAVNSADAVVRLGFTAGLVVKLGVTMLIPFIVSLSAAALTRLEVRAALTRAGVVDCATPSTDETETAPVPRA